ncbi:AAA domain-containing protein [Algoriphagus locisalis]|uniref:AAA domain-containing protein n=1 Tax=Algoriphagus locisalis TaxID=305507 RepID=A0A1I6XD68_9BACT|nr:AAA domain-containing protein [Algoriphagus locisalis]SFT36255.1 AAA domain-containing protein [Algoriphagus locisalis]
MIDKKITSLIGKAIREGKYLSITYKNKDGEITPFWISLLDINAKDELRVNMFNVTKDEPLLNRKIFISSIQTAEILKFSHWESSEKLIKRLDEDESLQVYEFERYDNNVLNYYLECYKANNDPFLHKAHLIQGVDLTELEKENPFPLTNQQQKQIIKDIYHSDYQRYYEYELAICELSIDLPSKGKFVIAYKKLTLDPVNKKLHLGSKTQFNSNFYIKDAKYSLAYYTDLSPADFEAIYTNDKHAAEELLKANFRTAELINTRPEIVVLGYAQIDISGIYDTIHAEFEQKEMEVPLKAFFQNLSLLDRQNRKEPHIALYDQNINIDQIQTIYNALKYPITYVQGPPGTGKTQTILNIIVNCLTNGKTLLISSNNNVPIDGIKDKLYLGKYRNKEILLPVLRLGNNERVAQAIQVIKERFAFETKDVPKEELLYNLKEKSKEKNRKLLERIKNHETRIEQSQNLEFVTSMLSKGGNHLLEKEKLAIEEKLKQIPETNNDDLDDLYEVIKDNHQLLQFFYFESLRYVKRLRSKDYAQLIEILEIEESKKQVKEFNKWIALDENMEKLTKVFPIILTTNISSRKLGRKYKFDLLVIDEAGQCDVATGLIPISKCKNMVLIGDTNQLKPIVVFEESIGQRLMRIFNIDKTYDYHSNSILSVYKRIDNISRDILLSYHYRCGKKIINYSNMRFYENKLNLSKIKINGELKLIDVNNVNQQLKNAAIEEADEIVKYIADNKLKDVFIITPFRNQEAVLNQYLGTAKAKNEIDKSVSCGTIHKIQGQENKTIIISTSISRNTTTRTYDWIKNNSQLINVGVTRAQENLIVVADKKAIDILSRKDDDLYALVEYVQNNGTTQIRQSTANRFTIGFSNDSKFEDEFYKTMSHYCSVQGSRFERNVKVLDVFPEEINNHAVNKKEFDGVIYQGRIPKVVFEINGAEHYRNKKRIDSDKIKMQLLHSKGIASIAIPNLYVKHYEFIRELMNKIKGGVYQKSLFEEYEFIS